MNGLVNLVKLELEQTTFTMTMTFQRPPNCDVSAVLRSCDVFNSLTISGPNSQKAVRESARVKGMVKLQRRRSLMARLITKMFLGVLIA